MALIFAFCDEFGSWHGIPSAPIDCEEPEEATLSYAPAPGSSGASSRFAGSQLRVLYAPMEGGPVGPIRYDLDDGPSCYGTEMVCELLGDPELPEQAAHDYFSELTPVAEAHASCPASPRAEITTAERRYAFTSRYTDDGRLYVDVVGCTEEGEVLTELEGPIPPADLGLLGRLFLAAAARSAAENTPLSRPQKANSRRVGTAWTEEEQELVAARYRAGTSAEAIAEELGRTERAIHFKLYQLDLAPFPAEQVPEPRPAPQKPEPAYTMEELRRVHPNSHQPWSEIEDTRLAERAEAGASITQLIHEFGRNEGAIRARLGRIGRPRKPSENSSDHRS